MSSKKPANGRRSVPGSAGQKRPAPPSAPRSAARKKSKQVAQATPVRPQPAMQSSSDDDSDDEEAIRRLKEAAAAKAAAAAHEDEDDEDDFEVAPGSDDEDEQTGSGARAGPPSDLDDSEDEVMRDADESEEEEKPRPKKQAPTPAKKAAPPATQSTPAKPSPSAKPTPAKSSPALKSIPAPAAAASAKKQALPSKKQASDNDSSSSSSDSETSDNETSDSEDETPAAKPASAKPVPSASSSATSAPKAAAKAKAKPSRVVLDDSSESSDDSDDDEPPPAFAKPQPPRKPTPLQGDASVNPPPKLAKPAAASSFDKPLSRPAPAPHTGRAFTVSIALPGSIIANAQSKELRTYVAGQIARAAATFNVDEIVVFAESGKQSHGGIRGNFEGATRSTDPDVFLARILQYLETPQYLRKQLFPKHADLVHAGLLNPLDSPHHVRADEEAPYREGVVLNRPVAPKQRGPQGACWANVGLKSEALVDRSIEPGTRLTVHIPDTVGSTSRKQLSGRAVAPSTPREKDGTYWGYTTRLAQNLSQVWSECPFKGGYDLSIGTSEHGEDCHSHSFGLPAFKHVIIFFGGLAGLEEHIAADESLSVKQPQDMFQLYINSVIGQGCRTIRTEEAIPITLAALYRHIRTNQPPQ